MANTTNYNWETPDDTDLVKDGAAAIRTLGSSIDTTTKNLNPETTTGDIAYRSATANTNTRLGIGSSGQVLTVAAGVPSWATPSTFTSPLTTKGDIYTRSATADTRLPVGTNGHTLVADSAEATGLKWAAASSGAMIKIASAPFSASAGVAINECFTSTYTDYILVVSGLGDSTNGNVFLQFQTGTSTVYSGSQYYGALLKLPETATPAYVGNAPSTKFTIGEIASNTRHTFTATINNVGNASANASYSAFGNMSSTGASLSGGIVNNLATYTGLYLTGAGNLTGNYAIYGLVK